jgi:hypothetical protein
MKFTPSAEVAPTVAPLSFSLPSPPLALCRRLPSGPPLPSLSCLRYSPPPPHTARSRTVGGRASTSCRRRHLVVIYLYSLSGSYLFVRGPPLFPIISRLRQRRLPALRRVARSAPPRCCVRPLQGSSRAPVGYTQRPMQKAGLMAAAAAAARRIQAAVLGASTAAAQRTRTALFESSSTAVGSRSLMSRDLLQRLAHKEVLLSNPFIPMVRCTTVTEVFLDRHHLRTASSCLFSPTPEACVCFRFLS